MQLCQSETVLVHKSNVSTFSAKSQYKSDHVCPELFVGQCKFLKQIPSCNLSVFGYKK